MITTKGDVIDINGKTEWILFHRLSKKVNPVDFLSLTDSIINFPGFLFTLSFLIMSFTNFDLQVKFLVPASLCFCGQIILNLRVGTSLIKLLNMPLLFFQKFNVFIMALVLIAVYFFSWLVDTCCNTCLFSYYGSFNCSSYFLSEEVLQVTLE